MRSAAVACVVALVTAAGCASGSNADRTPVAAATSPVGADAGQLAIGDELLLVASGAELETLAVLDPASGDLDPVTAPVEIEDTRPKQTVVGANADHVLVLTDDAAYLWDRRSDETTFVDYGGRILAAAPPHRPVAALLRTNRALHVVDLQSGVAREVDPPTTDGLVPQLAVDVAGEVAVVADPSGGAQAIDLRNGTSMRHHPELIFYRHGLAPDGTTVVAGRPTEHGLAVEARPVLGDGSPAVWYTPQRPEEQVAVTWVGDEVLAVDFTGRVMTVTGGVVTEIGRLRGVDTGVAAARIHPDPMSRRSSSALVEEHGADPARWFRVDVAAGTVQELTAVEGHSIVPSSVSGHVVVGEGGFDDGFASVRLVRLADGSVIDLFDDPAAPQVSFQTVSDRVLGISSVGGDRIKTVFYDVDGRQRGVVTDRIGFRVDPAATRAAIIDRQAEPVTRIVTIDGSAPDVLAPGVAPLDWLPSI